MKKLYAIISVLILATTSYAQFNPGNFEMRLTLPGGEPGKMRVQMRAVTNFMIPTTDDFCVDLSFAIWWDDIAHPEIADLDVVTANTYGGELSEANPVPGNSSGSGTPNGKLVNFSLNNFFQFPTNWSLNEWVNIADVFICSANNCSGGGFPPGIDAEDFLIQGFTGTLPNLNVTGNDFTPTAGPLPVTLVSFDAQKFGEKSSILNWTTASESNSSHFIAQRSTDKGTWSTLGYVDAAGNSQIIQNYSFIDENVYNGIDNRLTVYYRIQLVDFDGQSKNSPIESVVFGKSNLAFAREFLVYPNPASDGVQVEWQTEPSDQPTSLEIYDVTGKQVYTQDVADNSNQEYIDFGLTNIKSGLYILRIMSGDRAIEHKQIVVGQNR